jgi:hypothetical protein
MKDDVLPPITEIKGERALIATVAREGKRNPAILQLRCDNVVSRSYPQRSYKANVPRSLKSRLTRQNK